MWKYVACVLFLILCYVCRVGAQSITITVTEESYNCQTGKITVYYHVKLDDGVGSPNLSSLFGVIADGSSSSLGTSYDSEYDGYFTGDHHAGSPVWIWVEGWNNNSAPRKEQMFYPVITPPTDIPVITTTGIPLCNGSTGTMTATGYGGWLEWNNGYIGSVYNVNEVGTYSVRLKNYCGVTDYSEPVIVTNVTGAPPAPVIGASPATTLCNGGSATLFTYSNSGGTLYWSNNTTGPTTTISSPGTYYAYEVTSCGTSGNSNSVVITAVNTNDVPTISSSNGTTLCNGASTTLTAVSAHGGTVYWNTGETGNSIVVSAAGSYYAYEGTDCGTSDYSNTITITAGSAPAPPTIASNQASTLCDGSSATIFVPGFPSGITWSTGESGPSITVTAAGTYYARITNGCGTSTWSNAISFTTASTPTAPNVSPAGPIVVCNGSSTTLFAGGSAPFTWYKDDVPYNSGNSLSVNSAGTYTVKSNNICGYSGPSNAVIVTSGSSPAAPTITSSGTLICNGTPVGLSISASSGGAIHWNNGQTAAAIGVTAPGNYYAYESNGCGNSGNSNVITLSSANTPSAPSITPAGPLQLCNGNTVTLSVSGGGNTNWFKDGGLIAANAGTLVVSSPGSYTATLNNSCGISGQGNTVIVSSGGSPAAPTISSSGTIACNGGSVTLNASSGGGTIYWSNGATGNSISVSAAGTYYAYENNVCGNSGNSNSITITTGNTAPAPSLNVTGSITLCNGASQIISTTPSAGGVIHWSNGATGNSITVNTAGSYYAYESHSCGNSYNSATVNISTLSSPVAPTVTPPGSQLLCNGQTVSFNASGSSITWSNGATGNNMVTGVAGTYYAYDHNVCGNSPNSNSVVITTGNCPMPSPGTSFFICPGALKTLDAGAGYDTYAWSNGATTRTIAIGPGNYAVTVSKNGCFATSVTVSVSYYAVTIPTINASGPTTFCAGNSVTLSSSPASVYAWSNGATSNSINVTTSGSFYVTITDANGCQATSSATSVTVNPLPTASVSGNTSVCKSAGSPVITYTGNGGTAPYTFYYNINGGSTQTVTTSTNSVTVSVPTNVAGTFTYNLTGVQESSSTSCYNAASGSASVVVRDLPTAIIDGSTIVCLNSASPLITFTGSTGTAPFTFTYKINGGTNQTITTTSGNSVSVAVPTNVAGTFTYSLVSVQESSGLTCANSASGNATVIVRPLPLATIGGNTTICQNSTNPLITFTGSIGTAPYTFTYNINGGAAQTITTVSGNSVAVAVPTTTPGTYTYNLIGVQESGTGTCSNAASGSASVIVNPLPNANIAGNVTVCQNNAAPQITFTGSNATAPYTFTYKINGGANQTVTTVSGNSVTVNVPTNIAGTFVYDLVSVQESSSTTCINSASGSATVIVRPLPTATIAGTTAVCNNSTNPIIIFTGSVGTAPYTFTYNINGGTNQTVTTTSGNSVSINAPTNIVGTFVYNLIGVQESGSPSCLNTVSGSATITVNPLPLATIAGSTTVCQNSSSPSITFTGSGATAPYTFTYKINGVTNTIATTSGNSVTLSVPTGVAGTYLYELFSVQESSGTSCINNVTGSATIIVNPLPNTTISGNITVCQNSTSPQITFTGSNATAPYTFTYKINGVTKTVTTVSGNSVTVSVPTSVAGTYVYDLVSVQESSSTTCINTASGSATVIVRPLPTAIISGTTAVCSNSTNPLITFTGSIGNAPYTFTYNINGGASQTVTTVSGNSVSVAVPTNTPGTYTYNLISVQESGTGTCSNAASGSASVVVNPLPNAIIAGNVTVCQNNAAPQITFTGSNATSPYTFTYKINGGANQTVTTVSGNSVTVNIPTNIPGTYIYDLVSVQESSSTSCINAASGSATVIVRPLPTATIAGTTAVCNNSTNPVISFTGAIGTAPYTFTYNINGGTNQTVTTTSGNSVSINAPTNIVGSFVYNLVGVQESGSPSCMNSVSGSATITVNSLPLATIAGSTTICQNSTSPLITFTGSNATAPYTFTYSLNGVTNTVTTTSGNSVTVSVPTNVPGTFTYTLISVQESSGTSCSNVASGFATIIINPQPAAAVLLSPNTHLCNGETGQLTIYNWTEGFTYAWYKDGVLIATSSGQTLAITQAGSYTVMATSNLGCDAATISNAVIITTGTIATPIITGSLKVCEGGQTKLLVSPANNNMAYEWYRWTDTPMGDTVATDKSFSASAGQYTIFLGREGCLDTTVVTVTANDTEYPAGELKIYPTAIPYGGKATLTAEVQGAVRYEWDLGDSRKAVTFSGKVNQNFYVRDSVRVSVLAVSERNCKTTFSACVKIGAPDTLILKDQSWAGNLKDWNLFPVPFHNELKLSVILKRNETVKVDLFLSDGRWVRSWQLAGKKGENLFILNNTEGLKEGVMYFITAVYNGEKHFDKIYKY